jgi:hypothetical protein
MRVQKHNKWGKLIEETHWKNGVLHRQGGPAYMAWEEGDNCKMMLIVESYWKDGVMWRDDGPMERRWYPNGRLCHERYRVGKIYRYLSWNWDGTPYVLSLFENGKRHSLSCPAYQKWRTNGRRVVAEYWIDGVQVSRVYWGRYVAVGVLPAPIASALREHLA